MIEFKVIRFIFCLKGGETHVEALDAPQDRSLFRGLLLPVLGRTINRPVLGKT